MSKKTYILDTNVLIHDPESIFHFQENEVIVPFEALEELDKLKKRYDQTGNNARQTIRYLGDLVENGCLSDGLQLSEGGVLKVPPTFLQDGQSRKSVPCFPRNSARIQTTGLSPWHGSINRNTMETQFLFQKTLTPESRRRHWGYGPRIIRLIK